MKYYVAYKTEEEYTDEIEAENLEKAIDKVESEYCNVDLGELYDVNGNVIYVWGEY